MEITNAYRSARRNTSILCGIGIAWSAAQFELKSLNLDTIGSVDLSHASIPLMLAFGILYNLTRCILEFAMQSNDVRRWRLAQIDFKTTVFLVRATLLMLAASGLYRSLETVVYIIIAVLLLLTGSALLMFISLFIIAPFCMIIRVCQGRSSAAGSAIEASYLSQRITLVLIIAVIVAAGVVSLHYEPICSLWIVTPTPFAVITFVIVAITVVISMYTERIWSRKLFAFQNPLIMTKRPNGTIEVKHRSEKTENT